MQQSDISIPIPQKGSPLSADWAVKVSRTLNARRLVAGDGIILSKSPSGIVIKSTARGVVRARQGDSPPFACRYVTQEETGIYSGWEIYLPSGCVSVRHTHLPMNPPAQRKTGSGNDATTKDVPDWYRLAVADADGDDTKYVQAEQFGGETVYRDRLVVSVHAKSYSALDSKDGFEKFPCAYFLADAKSVNMPQSVTYTGDWGDTFSATVGLVTVTREQGGEYVRNYKNEAQGNIYVTRDAATRGFDLIHSLVINNSGFISSVSLYVTNNVFNAAGVTFNSNRIFDLNTTISTTPIKETSIYLKIDTQKSPYEGTLLVWQKASEGGGGGGEGEGGGDVITEDEFILENKSLTDIMVLLYRLEGGRVTLDNRNALNNIQVYM